MLHILVTQSYFSDTGLCEKSKTWLYLFQIRSFESKELMSPELKRKSWSPLCGIHSLRFRGMEDEVRWVRRAKK